MAAEGVIIGNPRMLHGVRLFLLRRGIVLRSNCFSGSQISREMQAGKEW